MQNKQEKELGFKLNINSMFIKVINTFELAKKNEVEKHIFWVKFSFFVLQIY